MEPTNQYVYVVVSSHNDYDQHVSYYEGIFKSPPTIDQLEELLGIHRFSAGGLYEKGELELDGVTYEIFRKDLL